ncbi:hypothetical protein AAEX63_10670 [Luteococcus sp. H138]|uniref:hypothetical protein n=1 Tax=unclassified Luteococcus TaxID=2639923 RepID=UPI00313C8F71
MANSPHPVSLYEDAVAHQRLVRDYVIGGSERDVPAQLPVAETSPLVAIVIHLIRGWYSSDDVLECSRILAAWEGIRAASRPAEQRGRTPDQAWRAAADQATA